jgi:Domain of unknown function (DUF4440)
MRLGAISPEELEALFEDAFVIRDPRAVADLFEADAVLAALGSTEVARGSAAIQALAARLWEGDHTYVADPRTVLQTRDTALVVASGAISVVRRGDHGWRYAISLLSLPHDNEER